MLLFVGVLAIAAVALIGSNMSPKEDNSGDNFVDLNEPNNNIAAIEDDNQVADNNLPSEGVVNNEQADNSTDDVATNDTADPDVVSNDELLEFADVQDIPQSEDPSTDSSDVLPESDEEEAVETAGSTVEADTNSVLDNLSFDSDVGLLWPVDGNVLLNYSMEHTIYFATLMQYKCNPAIIIDAEVGTEVKAAAEGVVSNIVWDEETGWTVTTSIGDGYDLVYGQLNEDDLTWKVGDVVQEGDVISTVAEPTKYYIVEGSNLYFKVTENDASVNPMLYLR